MMHNAETERWLALPRLPNEQEHTGPAVRSTEKLLGSMVNISNLNLDSSKLLG
jgi:hypothetical protein